MKNKSRRAFSTGKKQRKTRKNKGGEEKSYYVNGKRYYKHNPWNIFKKKSEERKAYEKYKLLMNSLVYIYYKKTGVLPLKWGEEEMKVIENNPDYKKYIKKNGPISPEFLEYINTIFIHKRDDQGKGNQYFCDQFENNDMHQRLKCNLRWKDKEFMQLYLYMLANNRIPENILNYLDDTDRETMCQTIGIKMNTHDFNRCKRGE